MLFKKVNLFLIVVMLLGVLSACAPAQTTEPAASGDETITIGLTMKFDDLWLTTLRDAMTRRSFTPAPSEVGSGCTIRSTFRG